MSPIAVKEMMNRMEIERNTAGEILMQSNRMKAQILDDKVALDNVVQSYTLGKNKLQAELIRNNALVVIKRVDQMRKVASLINSLRQLNF